MLNPDCFSTTFMCVGPICGVRPDRLPVDVGAVETAHIDDPEFASFAVKFGMAMADACVVGDDVIVGMAAC
jgi:hypothetical protein